MKPRSSEFELQLPDRLVFTIVTRNHFHYAAALEQQIREVDPSCVLAIVVADLWTPGQTDDWEWLHEAHESWRSSFGQVQQRRLLLAGRDVCNEPYDRFAFQYSAFELTCALKSQAGYWLMQHGVQQLLYLDADVRLYQPVDRIFDELPREGVLLTPHLRSRLPEDGRYPTNVDLLRTGNFNAGIWAARIEKTQPWSTSETHRILSWWRTCCQRDCIVDPHDGLFVDQKWLDQAVSVSDGVCISRNPGLNVGYWNLHEYDWKTSTLTAFHFSGVGEDVRRLSSHQNRHSVERGSRLEEMLRDYRKELVAQHQEHYAALPYAFDCLIDGTPIEAAWREVIRINSTGERDLVNDPFQHYANQWGHQRLNQHAEELAGGRFQWQQEQLHQRIKNLRNKLDRQPLRRLLKLLKERMRRA